MALHDDGPDSFSRVAPRWVILRHAASNPFVDPDSGRCLRAVHGLSSSPSRSNSTAGHDSIGAATRKSGGSEPSEQDLTEAYAHYGTGVIDEMNGEMESALEEYYEAAMGDSGNETLVLAVSRRLLQANQLDKALALLTRATSHRHVSGALYARLGLIYSRLEKPDLAIKADRNAIRAEPALLAGYQNLTILFLQTRRMKQAAALLTDAAKVPGTGAEFLIGLAELEANLGLQAPDQKAAASARALAALHRAEKLRIDDPELRLKLADGFNLLGKEKEAAGIYEDLLKELPDVPLLRENIRGKLANIYLRSNDSKQAAAQLQALIRDDPTDVDAYRWLGRIAYDDKKYSEASEFFSKMLLLQPDFEPGYYDLAGAQMSANQFREALETLEKARARFHQNFLLEYFSAMAYAREKEYTNALNHFNAAEVCARAGTNTLTSDFYFEFGAASERAGDPAQAEKYFEKCLQLSPDFAEALNYLGFMWADRGEKLDRARVLIEKALRIEPKNAAYLDSMGWVLFKLHDSQQALDYVLRAIHLSDEPDPALYDHLGDIYAALGEKSKALEAWGKSLALEPNADGEKKDPVR